MNVLVIGSSAWDTLLHVSEIKSIKDDMFMVANNKFESVGSTGAGKAIALDTLGADVTLITAIGNDPFGAKIQDFFRETNINLILLNASETLTHTNIMHGDGKRLSIVTSGPSNIKINVREFENHIINADMVYLNINDFCRGFIPYLKIHNKLVLVDIHDYDPPNPYHQEFIDAADILVCSGVNIPNPNNFLKEQIENNKQLAIITNGSKGLIALDKDNIQYNIEGFTDFKYVDSNGAGDSFCAGFGIKYMETNNIGKSLEYANICGGLACSSQDLFNRELNASTVEKIYKKRSN